MSKRSSQIMCCVVGCNNRYCNTDQNVKFYSFPSRPHEIGLKTKWILAVNRKETDGTVWKPSKSSRICSEHFTGGRKSQHPHSPAYVPSIFPECYKRKSAGSASLNRFKRLKNRREGMEQIPIKQEDVDSSNEQQVNHILIKQEVDCSVENKVYEIKQEGSENSEELDYGPLLTEVVYVKEDYESHSDFATPDYEERGLQALDAKEEALLDGRKFESKISYNITSECDSDSCQLAVKYTSNEIETDLSHIYNSCVDVNHSEEKNNYPSITLGSPFVDAVPAEDSGQYLNDAGSCKLQCHVCNKSFSHKGNLKRHMTIHIGDGRLQCHECNKSFSHKSYLDTHMMTHTGYRPFLCEICNKTFSQKGGLTLHMNSHTEVNKCDICNKSFTQKYTLNSHMAFHTGNFQYQCGVCSKCFSLKNVLNRHMLNHTGSRPFQCEVCEKSFSHKYLRNKHMVIHTANRTFQCQICNKSFFNNFSLRNHMVTHISASSDLCPFQCSICKKSFPYKSKLDRHMVMHTRNSLFKCDVCDKHFSQKVCLKKHLQKSCLPKQLGVHVRNLEVQTEVSSLKDTSL